MATLGWWLVLAIAPATAQVPATAQAPVDRDAVERAARAMMAEARYASLVTIGLDGHPQARIVDPFAPEPDMTVWFATNAATRKAREIAQDGRVTLLYFVEDDPGYVTLVGTAEAVTDPKERHARWKPEWSGFYSDDFRGDDYLLVRVRPIRIEVLSQRHDIQNDRVTWRPTQVEY